MRALIGHVTRVEIADGLRCAIDGDTVRVTLAPDPDDALSPDDAATRRAASLAGQLAEAQRHLTGITRERDALRGRLAASEQALTTATRERTDWCVRFGVLAGAVADLAAGRSTYASDLAGLSVEVAGDVATLALRLDAQPAHGGASGGAGVDVAARIDAAVNAVLRLPYSKTLRGDVNDIAMGLRQIAADARQPQRSPDEGHEPRQGGAEVVARVVIGEGPISGTADGDLYIDGVTVIGVGGSQTSDGLAGREGQQGRLVVELIHEANVAPSTDGRKSRGEVSP